MTAPGRYCCKSPKLPGANFLAVKKSDRRPPIDVASITLPRSPVARFGYRFRIGLCCSADIRGLARRARSETGRDLRRSAGRALEVFDDRLVET
jgi:hypothetical protein